MLAIKTIFTISSTTQSCLLESTNQKKEKSISDLLVIAHPERVAFGLSLASSSESQVNGRVTSLESSPPESMASLSYSSLSLSLIRLTAVSACHVVILCQCPGTSQCWLASSERSPFTTSNVLQLPLLPNCCCSLNVALARGGLSICLVLEHAFSAWFYLRTVPSKDNPPMIYLFLPTFLCLFSALFLIHQKL